MYKQRKLRENTINCSKKSHKLCDDKKVFKTVSIILTNITREADLLVFKYIHN